MNGVHDMGGMHGFGPVVVEENEPVFHEPWEGRVFALNLTTPLPGGGRPAIEAMAPADYLSSSYYEKWLHSLADLAVERGLISEAELDQRTHEYATGARNDDDH